MNKFSVTFEIITEESAEFGDAEERGFIACDIALRDAVALVQETASAQCSQEVVEANEAPVSNPRWITVYNSPDFITGETENRSLHFPENITAASRVRVARLLNCYGV